MATLLRGQRQLLGSTDWNRTFRTPRGTDECVELVNRSGAPAEGGTTMTWKRRESGSGTKVPPLALKPTRLCISLKTGLRLAGRKDQFSINSQVCPLQERCCMPPEASLPSRKHRHRHRRKAFYPKRGDVSQQSRYWGRRRKMHGLMRHRNAAGG